MTPLEELRRQLDAKRQASERRCRMYQDALNSLIVEARNDGVVLELITRSWSPPAMGNYSIIGLARPARQTYQELAVVDRAVVELERDVHAPLS